MTTQPRTWASYARLSRMKNDGKGGSLAIDRQLKENREYIHRVDGPNAVIVEFPDDGFSGYKANVIRPQYGAMLAGIEGGDFDAAVAWHGDRISRRVEVTGRIVQACEASETELHTALGGHHADPTRLYMEGVMAEAESRQKSNRLRSKHRELAEGGHFGGGVRRFGYTPDMGDVIESEAEIIRDLADRALRGESLHSLARSLNDADVPTARGSNPETGERYRWRPQMIRSMLLGPHLVGIREHTVKRKGKPVTTRTVASWEPILDDATHEGLVLKLTDPARRVSSSTSLKHLLSGLALCGHCGGKIQGVHVKREDRTRYRCRNRDCHRVNQIGAPIEEMVRAHIVKRLEQTDASGLLVTDDDARAMSALVAERDDIPGKRDELAALFAAGRLSSDGYANGLAALDERATELGAQIRLLAETAAGPKRVLDGATGPDAGRVWDEWTEDPTGAGLARQRAILELLAVIRISGAGRGARGTFRPETVAIEWRSL